MYAQITPFDFTKETYAVLDFSAKNEDLKDLDLENIEVFNAYVFNVLAKSEAKVGIGGWLEKRVIYDTKEHFQGDEPRCIHLGVDIWAKEYTPIFCPENCVVHSFQNNAGLGDYGPTIILQSTTSKIFYLFGHLSVNSLNSMQNRKVVKKGEHFAEIGPYPENGNWPPHLHFQVMNSMEGLKGDFPGVCSEKDLEHYKSLCLDPYPLLGLEIV